MQWIVWTNNVNKRNNTSEWHIHILNILHFKNYDHQTQYPHVWMIALHWRHNGHIASQITSLTNVYSTVFSVADQRKHQSSASLAFPRTKGQSRGKCFHLMTSSCETCCIITFHSSIQLLVKSTMNWVHNIKHAAKYVHSTDTCIYKVDYIWMTNKRWCHSNTSQIAKFTGLTWGPPWSCRRQIGPSVLSPWTLLSGNWARQTDCWTIRKTFGLLEGIWMPPSCRTSCPSVTITPHLI